jgi:hypothetical protein
MTNTHISNLHKHKHYFLKTPYKRKLKTPIIYKITKYSSPIIQLTSTADLIKTQQNGSNPHIKSIKFLQNNQEKTKLPIYQQAQILSNRRKIARTQMKKKSPEQRIGIKNPNFLFTNLILGSTECKNVVGEEMNWPMGLAVAPEINLNILSPDKAPVGNRLTQLLVSPELSSEALTLKLVSFKV